MNTLHTPEFIKRVRQMGLANKGFSRNADEKHGNWKGDSVGKDALHTWVIRKLGRPNICEFCGHDNKKTEWANVSQEYKRDINDWWRLCRSCHLSYDYQIGARHGRK
jgi:hypothetical protein